MSLATTNCVTLRFRLHITCPIAAPGLINSSLPLQKLLMATLAKGVVAVYSMAQKAAPKEKKRDILGLTQQSDKLPAV